MKIACAVAKCRIMINWSHLFGQGLSKRYHVFVSLLASKLLKISRTLFLITSPPGSMALKSRPCTCTASALAVFIRRVAHIDLVPALRHTSNIRSLSTARRNLSTFQPLQSQGTSHHETVNTTSYATAEIEDSIPYDQVRPNGRPDSSNPGRWPLQSSALGNLDQGRWAVGDLQKKHMVSGRDSLSPNMTFKVRRPNFESDISSFSEIGHKHEEGAAFLELNPGTIDVLAAKSLDNNVHMKLYAAKPTWEARPNHPRASMKGFKLHYSSPPVASTPKAREFKKQDSITSEVQVPDSRTTSYRRYPVTEREPWQIQKAVLKEKFKEGWNPRKKLSPDALAGIRAIHAQFPEQYTTSVLAEKFEVSPEAIRRILKSRWTPKEEEVLDRQRRWFLRGQKVWSRYSELGLKPPARWRELGIGKKGKYTAGQRERQSVNTNITMRSADHTVRESDETFSATPASMAERIL
jgi:hypothetical protein